MICLNSQYAELLQEFVVALKPRIRPTYKNWDEFDVVDDFNRPVGSVTGYRDRKGRLVYSLAIRGDDMTRKQAAMLLPPLVQMTGVKNA